MLKKVLLLAMVPVLVLGGYWLYRWNQELSFFAYLNKYSDNRGSGGSEATSDWLDTHHDEVLAYGRETCEWLEQQPVAPEVGAATSSGPMARNYATEVAPDRLVNEDAQYLVVTAAWGFLCSRTEDSRTSLPPGLD